MRTWTKIDKWRLARLKCQIRTMLRRLFYANSCRDAKVQKEFGGTVLYSGTNSGAIRAVGFLPNNFRSVDVLICACVQMFALRAFVSFRIAIFLSFLATSYTFCMYTYIYIYIFVWIFCFFLFRHIRIFLLARNFIFWIFLLFATTANKLCSSKWKLCNVH